MRKLIATGIATVAVVGAATVGTYSVSALQAHNGQTAGNGNGTPKMAQNGQGYGAQTMLETRAKLVGMTAEQLRTQLETKTMQQIVESKGMTLEQYQAKMREAAQQRWEARGLSDEEIAERKAQQAERQASGDCDGSGHQYAGNRHES